MNDHTSITLSPQPRCSARADLGAVDHPRGHQQPGRHPTASSSDASTRSSFRPGGVLDYTMTATRSRTGRLHGAGSGCRCRRRSHNGVHRRSSSRPGSAYTSLIALRAPASEPVRPPHASVTDRSHRDRDGRGHRVARRLHDTTRLDRAHHRAVGPSMLDNLERLTDGRRLSRWLIRPFSRRARRAGRRRRRSRCRGCRGRWSGCPWPRAGGRTRARRRGSLAVHFEPGVGLSGIRLTCTQPQSPYELSTSPSRSARQAWSLMPRIMAYSIETRRLVVARVVPGRLDGLAAPSSGC